jgi:hypothetical protein
MLLGLAMVGPLFAQSGWNNVTLTGGEVREPGRNLPSALVKGTAIVVTLYFPANLAYVVTLPLAWIQQAPQDRVGTAMMQPIFGTAGVLIMGAAIMISTFSSNNGLVLAIFIGLKFAACDLNGRFVKVRRHPERTPGPPLAKTAVPNAGYLWTPDSITDVSTETTAFM